MRIVVCVKHVPDATGERRFTDDGTVDRAAVEGLLSELDEYAVEQALSLVEQEGGEVTVLTVGPADALDAVRKALQMGAGHGILVSDDAIAGSDAPATSLVIATAIRKLEAVDLVVFGSSSTDGAMGVLPAMVAERLGLPQLTYVTDVRVDAGQLTGIRDSDTSRTTLATSLPAVLSVTDQANEPRYPSFKGIMAAKKKPVEEWSLVDLGLEPAAVGLAGSRSRVRHHAKRPARAQGTIVVDDGTGAAQLVNYLSSEQFV